ncbi:MAG: WbuC family cupin fold metalloprotein [Bacteroidales bacterium]|nr:WbuC family cupin fold metalloprotein [Bacteroidales bacterium]
MLLDFELFDSILPAAESSARGRMNYDLRTQAFEAGKPDHSGHKWSDTSQRMLNVLTPGTVIPIHRHNETSETVIVLRGAVEEVFFDASGAVLERHVLRYGGPCPGIQVPRGVYHTCRCLEPGSVIFEAKDQAYDPLGTEDVLEP